MNQLQYEIGSTALLKNYSRFDVEFINGEGAYLYDAEGREYLDFLSGIAVTGFGHKHPVIINAVREQIDKLWHTSNLFQSSLQEELAARLAGSSGLDYVFFCNSGTEANEAAIKFARKWGNGRSTIISALGSFHGRTMGSLAASGQYKLWEGFFPLTPGFKYVPFNDAEAVEHSINHDTVAVLVEPIQGESGIIVPSGDYLKKLREICDENNLLLIVDEVQTGMGRTGKIFAHQWEDVKPDIITTAKGIANGLPLGAVICTEQVAEVMTPGTHGSTFGGNPVAVAAANAVAELLTEETLAGIYSTGEALMNELRNIKNPLIKEIRGKGLLIGVELNVSARAKDIIKALLSKGVVCGYSGDNILRLLPPFVITEKEIIKFTGVFSSILNNYAG